MKLMSLLFLAGIVTAQTENMDVRYPQMKEGQMFAVKLTPAGKRLEVLITGKQAAKIEMDKLGITATMFLGDKPVVLTPKREKDRFFLEQSDLGKRLKLEIKEGKSQEQFDFDLPPKR